MKKNAGISLVEIIVVMAILMLLSATIWLVVGPSMHKKSYERTCASNMKQIATAVKLYATDNDDQIPVRWNDSRLASYIKTDPQNLNCPEAATLLGKKRFAYEYEMEAKAILGGLIKTRDLGKGRIAPEYDPDHDALLKCTRHFKGGYLPADAIPTRSTNTLRLDVLTAYPDTSVRFGPQLPCWQIPTLPSNLVEAAIAHCDGTIQGK